MIKMSGVGKNGRKIIILGITDENIRRLRDGKPIHIHADSLGIFGEIVILAGKDEATLQEQLAPLIGPETTIRDEAGRPKQ